ncbi:MAG: Rieske (2Fe-2S) protein [Actinomycetales bacterium]|nr:Rieske (2Fe-2S) protein [Actinomycetales bacterium]
MTRRNVLAGLGAVGAAATLAACASGGTTTPGSGTSGGATTPGADDGSTAPADPPAATGAIAKVADVPVGGAITAELDGVAVLIAQPTAGEFVGLSAICTHQGCTVAPDGDHLTCPCHGSTFDLAGAATQGPATESLATFALSVDGEDLVVGQA